MESGVVSKKLFALGRVFCYITGMDFSTTRPPLDHEFWMRCALGFAETAAAKGEIPVGAVVVHHPLNVAPKVIGEGYNLREATSDPTAHAEIVALRQAAGVLKQWRLIDCTLYVTLEPCSMCAGALTQSRLTRLVYGCRDPKAGAVHSLYTLCNDARLPHRLEVVEGVLAVECAGVLKSFFAARRKPLSRGSNPAAIEPPAPIG